MNERKSGMKIFKKNQANSSEAKIIPKICSKINYFMLEICKEFLLLIRINFV